MVGRCAGTCPAGLFRSGHESAPLAIYTYTTGSDLVPRRRGGLSSMTAPARICRPGRARLQLIHQRFQENIAELYQSQLGGRPVPLVVLAHSFGSHIFSNFTWDHQHHPDPTLSSFERMNWLTVIVTSGSNIPLFTFACREVIPIRFPPPRLPSRLKQKARWLNYFDYDDVLGWPLKPINKAYAQTVSEDRAIRVGGALTGWNPTSHSRYWSERKFVGEVARLLTTFL